MTPPLASAIPKSNTAAIFGQAVSFFNVGQIDTAEALCRRLIQLEPSHCDALHVLGIVALKKGQAANGAEFICRALEIDSTRPHVHCSLGNAFRDMQRPADALASYRRALELAPHFFGAWYGEGNALTDLGRPDEALASYDRALHFHPDHPESHQNRGNVLLSLGRLDEALGSYQRALALRPTAVSVLSNCADVLRKLGRREEALAVYDQLLAAQPGDAEVLINRALVLYELERFEETITGLDSALVRRPDSAAARYTRANAWLCLNQFTQALADYDVLLQVEPTLAEAHCNRGSSLLGLERHGEALESFEAALRLKPELVTAADGQGSSLRALHRYEEALAAFEYALSLAPSSSDIRYRRAVALRHLLRHEDAASAFADVLRVAPQYDYALGNLLHERLQICDWSGYEELVASVSQSVLEGKRACLPGPFLSASDSAPAQLQCSRTYFADKHPAQQPLKSGPIVPDGHDRIRVAYVSADFREHPVSHLLAGVLEQHDRRRFDTLAISLTLPDESLIGKRVRSAFTQFVDVSQSSDREVLALLRELEVDIAVDLTGLTSGSRPGLFAVRPAPVQVNFLGYPGTLGAACYDYIVADRIVIPESDRSFYDEKVIYLPHCFQPNDTSRPSTDRVPTRAECALPDRGFVFCCFNTHYKISPRLFDVWMRLLGNTEGSVLWLAAGDETVTRNLRREAAARGVAPERLVFAPRLPEQADHLARYQLADLFLDTLPFNAHTTASDVLWAGLPLLTCRGSSYAARVSASLLTAMGCPELITSNLEDYEACAEKIAKTPAFLDELRSRLASNRLTTPLFDTQRYCRDLESAYVTMYERCKRGEAPQSFTVS
jgi:protein O-GlcNAc transferase